MRETIRTMRKRDFAVLLGITGVLLAVIFSMTGTTNLFGSMTDWVSQHSVLPEYYRQTFYETGELLPEFAFQLGGGQNAYYFGYYGFLNPIILVSYLLPGVSMVTYLQFASVTMLIASVWMFFLWLRHIRIAFGDAASFGDGAIYTATALFALASPLLFHSHRQIMFVDYMPFLLLALIAVDRFFARRRGALLSIAVALLFFTSYFYAVPGVLVITLYGLYRYFSTAENVTFKSFAAKGGGFALCMVTGVFIAAILTIPSLMTIFSGREDGTKARFELRFRLIGDMNFAGSVCYSEYSMGMTALAYLSLCVFAATALWKLLAKLSGHKIKAAGLQVSGGLQTATTQKSDAKRPDDAFLAIAILLCAWLPWIRFALNGFLYTREKILIPFVPVTALLIARMIHKIQKEEISIRFFTTVSAAAAVLGAVGYLFRGSYPMIALLLLDSFGTVLLVRAAVRNRSILPLAGPVVGLALVVVISCSLREEPVSRSYAGLLHDDAREQKLMRVLSGDNGVYRSAEFVEAEYGVNRLHGNHYLSTGYYSSLGNSEYLRLLYRDLHVANPSVNDISYTPQPDILLQTLLGVRYISADETVPAGWHPVEESFGEKGGVYENHGAYTLAFVADRRMSLREYESLSPADREIALMSYAVTEEDGPDVYTSPLTDTGITPDFGVPADADGNLHLGNCQEKEFTVPIPDSLSDYVYIVTMRIAQRRLQYTSVTVNGITNVLSGSKNARPNDNFDIKFVVSSAEPCNKLTFRFTGEDVIVSVPRIQRMPSSEVRAAGEHMTMASELSIPKNNRVVGKIAPEEEGVLLLTVPYDPNWTIRLNGEEVPVIRTDNGFLGCYTEAGEQTFEMIYHAPGRSIGIGLTAVGFIMLIGLMTAPFFLEKRRLAEV